MTDDDWTDRRDWEDDAWADHGWVDQDAGLQPGGGPGHDTDGWDDEWIAAEDEEWVDVHAPMSGGRKFLIAFGVVALVAVLALGGAWFWVQGQIDPSGDPGEEVALEVPTGSTTEDIGGVLADNGVISSSTVWNYWTRFNDVGPFQAGEYVFQENSSFDQAVLVLDAGPRPPDADTVTIPEGLTVAEIIPRLADPETGVERWSVENLQAALDSGEVRSQFQPPDQASMEGMLFPETYDIEDETDERSFLRRLVTQLDETLVGLDAEGRGAALGVTPYEVVVIASLIEEEARVEGDRAKIARVIYNRLDRGIPLGIDATSRYEAEIEGRGRDDLDFESDSPYNTRRIAGLPPTPIAAAGQASIEAALNPEPGEWIYYVLADEEGNHTFAVTDSEFQVAKQECIRLDLGCG